MITRKERENETLTPNLYDATSCRVRNVMRSLFEQYAQSGRDEGKRRDERIELELELEDSV